MSGEDDLYKLLGLERNANVDDIRKAYKELSRIHHPDKGGDEEMFKKINRANEILSDPEKRQMYDVTGSTQEGGGGVGHPFGGMPFGFGPGGFHMNVDIGDLFGNMFGGGRGAGPRRKVKRPIGPNKTHELPLNLHDFYHGKKISINLNRQVFCDLCHGDGCMNWKTCDTCKGMGHTESMIQMGPGIMAINRGPCLSCQSEGRLRGTSCTGCEAKGLVNKQKTVEVEVKPGAAINDCFTCKGMCSDDIEYEKPGDLIFRFVAADEELDVVREGNHLRARFTISLKDALMGCQRVIQSHPGHSNLSVDIHHGVQSGETIRVKGMGMPGGDLLVTITVITNEAEKKALESHKAILQSIFI
jgi:molecular chaperone DnaJ